MWTYWISARRTWLRPSWKNFNDEINNNFMHNYYSKIRNYVKLIIKVSRKWKNWSDFRVVHSTPVARRSLVEDEDTILELTDKIQELQNEVNCMNDSRAFQEAESILSGNSHVTSRPVSFPPRPIPEGMLSRSLGMPSRREGPPSILGHTWYIGKRFCKSSCVIFSTLSAGIESMEFRKRRAASLIHSGKEWETNTRSTSEMPVGTVSQKISLHSGGESSKNYWADQQRLQISDLHFDKFPTPATFACWKIRFKTEVCTCSQFHTETSHWIKEVEMVDSVDDLMSSSSTRGIQMPNFEVLDARIASALNRIIHISHFKRRISLEEQKGQKQDRFRRGRQIAYLIYEFFRVTGSPRFCRELHRPIHY